MFDPEFIIVVEEIRLANDDYIPQLRQILECQNYIMHSSRLVDEDAVNYKCRASGCLILRVIGILIFVVYAL
jgi:hypothetical protein